MQPTDIFGGLELDMLLLPVVGGLIKGISQVGAIKFGVLNPGNMASTGSVVFISGASVANYPDFSLDSHYPALFHMTPVFPKLPSLYLSPG